ncbi:hypothetical protein Droror1_Dr00026719 [Drosera rotundifolia]
MILDWPTRYQIAIGVAHGLAYLHHDLLTPIVHRDIKSFNILLAKVLQARGGKDSSSTVIAGTYGYLDPVTAKKPVEAEFGENKNIINWVSPKMKTKERAQEILDNRLSGTFKEDMIQVLRIAVRCTARALAPRPTMNEVVQLLVEVDQHRFDSSGIN